MISSIKIPIQSSEQKIVIRRITRFFWSLIQNRNNPKNPMKASNLDLYWYLNSYFSVTEGLTSTIKVPIDKFDFVKHLIEIL